MADGQGNINRSKNTGTVPKIKYSNNAMEIRASKDQIRSPRMANNLAPSWRVHSPNFIRNKGRNRQLVMEIALDGPEIPATNGVANYAVNGVTPGSSSSTSRRNSASSSLKCDNITKYPDRKQIEDKLTQIREYLEVTSSLMTSIRNSDEQIFDIEEKTNLLQTRNDLLDSEKKLSNLLEEIDKSEMAEAQAQALVNIDNDSENSVDFTKRAESDLDSFDNELTALRDQQLSLLNLRQKSENRLKDARRVQDKLSSASLSSNNIDNQQKYDKNMSLSDFDSAIRELEERANHINRNKDANSNEHNLVSEMQQLQSQIISMHEANNEREQLIEVLDNRDTELRTQQAELKKKLTELQTKKDQVDQLVMQLQIMDEDASNPDVAAEVHNIVNMKEKLSKLKDMLEIVQNTTEQATPADVAAAANEICLTAENLQNEISKPSHRRNDSFVENRLDNHVTNSQKQVNKSQGAQPKPRTSSINEKIALQSELEAKKRELEEIMGKHKAATSNLNHDVRGNPGNDMSWKPPIFSRDQDSDDRLSSDGDEHDYAEVSQQDGANVFPHHQQLNSYYVQNRSKRGSDRRSQRLRSASRTPDRNLRGLSVNSVNASEVSRQSSTRAPTNNRNHEKLQKQLELIKTLCDSVLEQDAQAPRNCYSTEPQQRVSCPPSPFRANQNRVNLFQPIAADQPPPQWTNQPADYQHWLATNTLQTQSFMLNTLNQCCQMLWLQQRELAQLRNTVNSLQERVDVGQSTGGTFAQTPYDQSLPPTNNQLRVPTAPPPPKTNHHVSAACSMPNLNQCNPVSNSDMAFANAAHHGLPNSALLESCLNNATLHANLNSNLNHQPPPLWNGQALNNQVAPGNRANNYWDNFRSYSRQNQLSSKNSESSVHNGPTVFERFQLDRVNPFPLMGTSSKTNSEHSSTNSRENTPRKHSFKIPRQNVETVSPCAEQQQQQAPPPDVLNVNAQSQLGSEPRFSLGGLDVDLSRLLTVSCHSNLSAADGEAGGDEPPRPARQDQRTPKKNKLLDELRENVYKEVASLISANEARPHFLIQLFKDLQKIESDALRLKILQSVQNILTQSMASRSVGEPELAAPSEQPSGSPWTRTTKQFSSEILNLRLETDEPFLQNSYKEIVQLLDSREGDVITTSLLSNVKQVFLDSDLFKESVKDAVFLKHFSNMLNDVLEQYRGKMVREVKSHLIQTVGDLLQGELSFIHLIQETIPESAICQEDKEMINYGVASFDVQQQQSDNVQNDDLTEADQDRLGQSELEDEGAVGGLLIQEDLPVIELPNGEGLDQVPTRLATKMKSGTNTPTSDLSGSHRDNEPY